MPVSAPRSERDRWTPKPAARRWRGYDAILTTIGDDWSVEAFGGGPHRCRLLANFGVGWNHVDGAAAEAAGVMVSQHAGRDDPSPRRTSP